MTKSKSGPETEQEYAQENACPMQLVPFRGMLFLKGIKYFIALVTDLESTGGQRGVRKQPPDPPPHQSIAHRNAALVFRGEEGEGGAKGVRVTLPCLAPSAGRTRWEVLRAFCKGAVQVLLLGCLQPLF